MLIYLFAVLLPPIGGFLTLARGCTYPGHRPLGVLTAWLFLQTDEPRWTLYRPWMLILIGAFPGGVLYVAGLYPHEEMVPWWVWPVLVWISTGAAFSLGHARWQGYGWRNYMGMAFSGFEMVVIPVAILVDAGHYWAAGAVLAGGLLKGGSYALGWETDIGERIDEWMAPTRLGELLHGVFLYGGYAAAILIGAR